MESLDYKKYIDNEVRILKNRYNSKKENILIIQDDDVVGTELKNLSSEQLFNKIVNQKTINIKNYDSYYINYGEVLLDIFEEELLRRRTEKINKILKR